MPVVVLVPCTHTYSSAALRTAIFIWGEVIVGDRDTVEVQNLPLPDPALAVSDVYMA
jgi:hypothetical protein